jgi:RHS repeat-associated protein
MAFARTNSPPVANDDSYNLHGSNFIGPLLQNDVDDDNDPMHVQVVTSPAHGTLSGVDGNIFFYTLDNFIFIGTDTFTYKACDPSNACSSPATVTINIHNLPPTAGPDQYTVRGNTIIGPLQVNDSDPDNDSLSEPILIVSAAHGTVFGVPVPPFAIGQKEYVPDTGFSGTDSFVYQVCDRFNACASATVTLYVIADGEDDGATSCNARVGRPVNVTNGNVYLQQGDYELPGIGPELDVTRTYNSKSQRVGLFGKGWSTAYDESIVVYDNNLARLNQEDGRAIYLGRQIGSSGAFAPLVGDFHGSLVQNGGAGFTLTLKDGSVSQFNSTGKLVSRADRNGNITTLTYDGNGFLSSVTDPFGRVLTVTTDGSGRALTIGDPLGTIATYTYGGSNELLSVTYAENSAFQFGYDGDLRLTSVTDALGNLVESHTYDAQGRALTSESQGGVERYSLSYLSNTETEVTDALGHVTKYINDKSKGRNVVTRLEGLCSCGGGGSQVQTWTYDNQLNVTNQTDALNHTRTFTYDTNGNRLTETDATGTVTYTYNGFGQVLTRTNQLGGVTTITYDPLGNPLTAKDALNNTTAFTHDSHGLPLTVTDARGKVTTYTWDAHGRMTQSKDALNQTTDFAYDARARLTSVTNALNETISYQYDAAGRLKKITFPDSNFVSNTYDLAGRRTRVTDPRGNETNFAYDGAYRLTRVTDATSHATSMGYDAMSNKTSMTDALGRVTNYQYDDFNRLKQVIYPPAATGARALQELFAYDAAGNVTKKTDTAGRATTFVYDNVNRLASSTDAANELTAFQYDALSRTTAVVDALGQHYEFAYDDLGRQTGMTRGEASMSFAYDAVGNQTARTDYNGATTNYTYDDLNRLTTIVYPDDTNAAYRYDALSRLTAAVNENGTVSFAYDNRGRIASTTDVFNQTLSYTYDANGNRTALIVNGATYAAYSYDALNRLTDLGDGAATVAVYAFDAVSKPTSQTLRNGVVSTYEYDGHDRLTRLRDVRGATPILDNQYSYNTAHQITGVAGLGGAHAYGYDQVNRLTSATHPITDAESFAYDEVGNRTSGGGVEYVYGPANRLAAFGSLQFSYDANGNQLTRISEPTASTRTYDFENRLTEVQIGGGSGGSIGLDPRVTTIGYKYDALGRRIERTPSDGRVEKFLYDGQDVVQDLDGDGAVRVSYLNGPGIDNKIRQSDANGNLYFSTDHLGSTRALTDDSGSVVEQIDYDSFGNRNGGGSGRTRYTYTGREYDAATSLYYYRARWYDPLAGRFISEDPIGLAGGVNQFTYVGNNSLNATDPTGLYEIDVHYYLTYYLARKTGCFTDQQAREIADHDQLTDDDDDKAPGALRAQRNVAFHAFGTHEQNAIRQNELWGLATQGSGSLSNLGTFLHFVQDSYSHYDFAGNANTGQAKGGYSPDHTNSNPTKAMVMARKSWDFLNLFGRSKGMCCKPQEPDWAVVAAFASVGYDLSTRTGRMLDATSPMGPQQLRLKIQILDVPWRSANGISRP